MNIELFASLIPPSLREESGKTFYSGRLAFSDPSPLYILGVNPGGDPANYVDETVERHTARVLKQWPDDWSAYRDETWEGAKAGTYGMAPRVLHLFNQLGLDPGRVAASNLFFVRSRREQHIRDRQSHLADLCWPFHSKVIEVLQPQVVLCLGSTAGRYVRRQLGTNRVIDAFVERNNRRWKSLTYEGDGAIRVVVATHPSIADWTSVDTDPSPLVQRALKRDA